MSALFLGWEQHIWAWLIAGIFTLLASFISIAHMRAHFIYNSDHILRRHTIRILGMVPVYSVEAWCGLYAKNYTLYFDVARESYEAFVIYSFAQFILHLLGGPSGLHALLARSSINSDKPLHPHLFPLNHCLPGWRTDTNEFSYKMRIGILQYVPTKVAVAVLQYICQMTGIYRDGQIRWDAGYPYIMFISNVSQLWALYCLVLLYETTKQELAHIKPLAKFICIKAVVFFTFWQGLGIAALLKYGKIHDSKSYSSEEAAAGLQDFIICIEMLFAACAHLYAFPAKEFSSYECEYTHIETGEPVILDSYNKQQLGGTDLGKRDTDSVIVNHTEKILPMLYQTLTPVDIVREAVDLVKVKEKMIVRATRKGSEKGSEKKDDEEEDEKDGSVKLYEQKKVVKDEGEDGTKVKVEDRVSANAGKIKLKERVSVTVPMQQRQGKKYGTFTATYKGEKKV